MNGGVELSAGPIPEPNYNLHVNFGAGPSFDLGLTAPDLLLAVLDKLLRDGHIAGDPSDESLRHALDLLIQAKDMAKRV